MIPKSDWTEINGLQVKYIGSCCESFEVGSVRDYILVTSPLYNTFSGISTQYKLFYKSTGTSDELSNRKNTWFPCNGFVNKLFYNSENDVVKFINWVDKGGYLKLKNQMYSPNRNYELLYNLYQQYSKIGYKKIIKVLTERFHTDDNLIISMKLGGGLWNIDEILKTMRQEHTLQDIYSLPERVYKSREDINHTMSINSEYGIPLENALEMSNLLYEIANQQKWSDQIVAKLYDIYDKYDINISADLFNDDDYNNNSKYLDTIPHDETAKLIAIIGYKTPEYNDLLSLLQIEQKGGNYNIYNKIVNPKSGKSVLISGKIGRKILQEYINQLNF